MIRYLIVWRVNGSFAQLPRCLSVDLSRTLGTLIAERLPTQQARAWRKALAVWGKAVDDQSPDDPAAGAVPGTANAKSHRRKGPGEAPTEAAAPIPEAAWPIEAVLWPYPGKRAYGQGEPIVWELKLLGNDADHGLFLEVILPAMEEAATTSDERWHQSRTLWGRFDIQAAYVARGARWEPVVSDGRLDLSYRPTPAQWAEGLAFAAESKRRFHKLTWLTPYDFRFQISDFRLSDAASNLQSPFSVLQSNAPSLRDLLDALMARMALFLPGKRPTPEQALALLSPEEQMTLWLDCEEGKLKRQALEPAPKGWPGRWIGDQTFAVIPAGVVPYLELASILHVGRQTHFGCGTFMLT